MTDNPLTIVSLDITDFARIKAVLIEPDPTSHSIVITGKNAQGKSSVMDAIRMAIDASGYRIDNPVHIGADEAEIVTTLGRNGVPELIVTRKIQPDGKTTLKVVDAEGTNQAAPASLLKSFFGILSLDPMRFVNADEKTQIKMLVDLIDFDYDRWSAERRSIFDRRKVTNSEVTRLTNLKKSLPKPQTDRTEPVSAVELIGTLRSMQKSRTAEDEANQLVTKWVTHVTSLKEQLASAEVSLEQARQYYAQVPAPASIEDLDAVEKQIENIDAENDKIRNAAKWHEANDALVGATNLAASQTKMLTDLDDALKAELTSLPVQGLSFDPENGVVYNDVSFSRASRAEKAKISIAIGIAAKPDSGVILVEDASLFDEETMGTIRAMASHHNMQLWLEVVNSSDADGITIEDGEVA
jgi:DNA repair exonuclease SbcCD ATPase subunit